MDTTFYTQEELEIMNAEAGSDTEVQQQEVIYYQDPELQKLSPEQREFAASVNNYNASEGEYTDKNIAKVQNVGSIIGAVITIATGVPFVFFALVGFCIALYFDLQENDGFFAAISSDLGTYLMVLIPFVVGLAVVIKGISMLPLKKNKKNSVRHLDRFE